MGMVVVGGGCDDAWQVRKAYYLVLSWLMVVVSSLLV
uniref:Uncharacterized protein n=1 Tax=Rhizophora mucronata TaxID=61149 RepID=A0A2P2PSG6_RHIMU